MRKVTREYDVYKFNELPEDIKQKVIANNHDINTDYNWWESIYEDASHIGLKTTEFDLSYRQSISTDPMDSCENIAKLIMKEHGIECETYKIAEKYLTAFNSLRDNHPNDDDYDTALEALDEQFITEISRQYWLTLRQEYEYRTSDEAISDTLIANECEFLANGTPFRG